MTMIRLFLTLFFSFAFLVLSFLSLFIYTFFAPQAPLSTLSWSLHPSQTVYLVPFVPLTRDNKPSYHRSSLLCCRRQT